MKMEHTEILLPAVMPVVIAPVETEHANNKRSSFIEANTIPGSLEEIKHNHIIPVFSNNEPLISHADFIEVTSSLTTDLFHGEHILKPDIRVSHAVMGRILMPKINLLTSYLIGRRLYITREWLSLLKFHLYSLTLTVIRFR